MEQLKEEFKRGVNIRTRYLWSYGVVMLYVVILAAAIYLARTADSRWQNILAGVLVVFAQIVLIYALAGFYESLIDHLELVDTMATHSANIANASGLVKLGIKINILLVFLYVVCLMFIVAAHMLPYTCSAIFFGLIAVSSIITFGGLYLSLYQLTRNVFFLLSYLFFLPILPTIAYTNYRLSTGSEMSTPMLLWTAIFVLVMWGLHLLLFTLSYASSGRK